MEKEEILDKSRSSKTDERKIFIERQAYTNVVYVSMAVFLLFSIFKYILNKDILDLNTVMVFLSPAWAMFLATKFYYNRKWLTLLCSIVFAVISLFAIVNFFIPIFPLAIFQ